MTASEFMNCWNVLRSIDRHELIAAGIAISDASWREFIANPVLWLRYADANDAERLWGIVQKRSAR